MRFLRGFKAEVRLDGLDVGEYIAEIVVRAEPRLRAVLTIDAAGARISEMVVLGHGQNPLGAKYFMIQDAKVIKAVEPAAGWSEVGLEGKWKVYAETPVNKRAGVVKWLAENKDFAFIEKIAIYDVDGMNFHEN